MAKRFLLTAFFVFVLFAAKVKSRASDVFAMPEPMGYCGGKSVYSDDISVSIDTSFFGSVSDLKVTAEGAALTQTQEGSYVISGEGNIRIIAFFIHTNEEGLRIEERYDCSFIIDKTPPVINVSFADESNENGSIRKRTMYFSFSDLSVDYDTMTVCVNNETVDYDIPNLGQIDFSLDFDGEGTFEGWIRIRDKAGHESVRYIEKFELSKGGTVTHESITEESPANNKESDKQNKEEAKENTKETKENETNLKEEQSKDKEEATGDNEGETAEVNDYENAPTTVEETEIKKEELYLYDMEEKEEKGVVYKGEIVMKEFLKEGDAVFKKAKRGRRNVRTLGYSLMAFSIAFFACSLGRIAKKK